MGTKCCVDTSGLGSEDGTTLSSVQMSKNLIQGKISETEGRALTMHNEDHLLRLGCRIPLGNWQDRSAGIFCKWPHPWHWDSAYRQGWAMGGFAWVSSSIREWGCPSSGDMHWRAHRDQPGNKMPFQALSPADAGLSMEDGGTSWGCWVVGRWKCRSSVCLFSYFKKKIPELPEPWNFIWSLFIFKMLVVN